MKQPTLTVGQILDAVFSNKYDEKKVAEIKKFQKSQKKAK